ncbi:MAG: PAS domain-containing protein [Bryobacterales bacterium]|nr:PAS domain-containing protein [Bryobacterales bacterium]
MKPDIHAPGCDSETLACELADSIDDGLFALDDEFVFAYVNSSAEKTLGHSRSELLGRTLWDAFPGLIGTPFEENYRRAASLRQPVCFESYDPLRRCWLETNLTPRPAGGIFSWFRDISGRKLAQQELRESQVRYRTVVEGLPLFVWTCTPGGECDYLSPQWIDYTGVPEADQVGYGWLAVVHPDDRPAVVDRWRSVVGTGERFDVEFRIRGGDGVYRWFQTRALPIHDENGGIVKWFGTNTDIDHRKRTEQELRATQERLRAALEASRTGTFRWDIASGEIDFDESLHALFGLAPVPGPRTAAEFFALIHPEDRDTVMADCLCSAVDCSPLERDFRVVWADGSVHWLAAKGKTRADEQGRPLYITGACLEITGSKRIEEDLRRSEERFRVALHGSNIAVAQQDPDLRYTWIHNPQPGFSASTILGKTDADLLSSEDAAPVIEIKRRVLASGAGAQGELALSVDGRLRHYLYNYEPARDEAGRIVGLTSATVDLTDHKALAQRVHEAQKLESIGLLAGGIAHDFNNLLVGILGNASLAAELLPPGSPAEEFSGQVVKAAESAARLTREMLAYSGKGRTALETLDLAELVRRVARLVQSSIPARASLRLDLTPDLPAIRAHTGQIQQLLMNVIINAAEALGEEPGLITVRLGSVSLNRSEAAACRLPAGRYVRLEVLDNGCGMDEATKARIFEPFFTTKATGSGLGLSAVSGIVRAHGGTVEVSSTPGTGTSFVVLFPAALRAAQPGTSQAAASARVAGTVLVVDDEPMVLNVARAALQQAGHKVLTARSGEQAIEVLQRHAGQPPVVLLDLGMPGLSGEETLVRLRELRPGIPVLISSGYNRVEVERRVNGQPVSGFVQKPYTAAALCAMVQALLEAGPDESGGSQPPYSLPGRK